MESHNYWLVSRICIQDGTDSILSCVIQMSKIAIGSQALRAQPCPQFGSGSISSEYEEKSSLYQGNWCRMRTFGLVRLQCHERPVDRGKDLRP